MATSRTGTSGWKKVSKHALHLAQAQGITRCPYCNVLMDYEQRAQHNGAQVDHILSVARGGTNELHNLTVCCARCNQSKGARNQPKDIPTLLKKTRRQQLADQPLKTSRDW